MQKRHPIPLHKSPGECGDQNGGPIPTKPKNSLWTGSRVRPANGIHKGLAKKPFEILLVIFSSVEKKSHIGMAISCAKRNPVIHLAVSDTMMLDYVSL